MLCVVGRSGKSGEKMNKKKVFVLGVLVLVLSLAAVGCGKQATATTAQQVLPDTAPGHPGECRNCCEHSGPANSGVQWPSKMPTDVPSSPTEQSPDPTMMSWEVSRQHIKMWARMPIPSTGWFESGWLDNNERHQSADGFEIDAAKAPRGVVACSSTQKAMAQGAITYNDHSGQ